MLGGHYLIDVKEISQTDRHKLEKDLPEGKGYEASSRTNEWDGSKMTILLPLIAGDFSCTLKCSIHLATFSGVFAVLK